MKVSGHIFGTKRYPGNIYGNIYGNRGSNVIAMKTIGDNVINPKFGSFLSFGDHTLPPINMLFLIGFMAFCWCFTTSHRRRW